MKMWAYLHPDPANAKVGDEVTVVPVELGEPEERVPPFRFVV